MSSFWIAGLASAVAAGMVMKAVPFVTRLAMAIRAVDYPGKRRFQNGPTPRMGGIAIVGGIAAGVVTPSLLWWRQWSGITEPPYLAAVVFGTTVVLVIGVADDVMGLSPLQRFLVQMVAALGVVSTGLSFDLVYIPLWGEVQPGIWGRVAAVAWIVGVTNAINLLDGLDGLASGVAAIVALNLLALGWMQASFPTIVLMSAIAGACLGFLRYNWTPARIYMGDSGALTLGFLLGVMSLHTAVKETAVATFMPILTLGLPVIDTLSVMVARFVEGPERSFARRFARMFHADRNHLHHRMTRTRLSRKQIVLVIYLVAACFSLMALVVAVHHSVPLGAALVVVEVVVVSAMRQTGARRNVLSLSPKQSAPIPVRTSVQIKYAERH